MSPMPLGLASLLALGLTFEAPHAWSADAKPAVAGPESTAPAMQPEAESTPAQPPQPSAGKPASPAAAAAGAPPSDQTDSGLPPVPISYLNAVRAQRESLIAREREAASERSDAMRKQMEERRAWVQDQARARRWWYDPQGEYLTELSQQRTEALKAQSKALRDQAQQQADAMRRQMDQMREAHEHWMLQNTPYGWNNPWYYRGF